MAVDLGSAYAEIKLDIASLQRGVKGAREELSKLRNETGKTDDSLAGLEKQSKKTGDSLDNNLGKGASSVTDSLGSFAAAGLAGAAAALALGTAIKAVELGGMALDLEKAENSAKLLSGTTERYNDLMVLAKRNQETFGGSLVENIQGLTGLANSARQANIPIEKLNDLAQRLNILSPEQGLGGAAVALKEALGGDTLSLRERFELDKNALKGFSDQSLDAADRAEKLNKVLEKQGVAAGQAEQAISARARTYTNIGAQFEQISLKAGDSLTDIFLQPALGAERLLRALNGNKEAIAEITAIGTGGGMVSSQISEWDQQTLSNNINAYFRMNDAAKALIPTLLEVGSSSKAASFFADSLAANVAEGIITIDDANLALSQYKQAMQDAGKATEETASTTNSFIASLANQAGAFVASANQLLATTNALKEQRKALGTDAERLGIALGESQGLTGVPLIQKQTEALKLQQRLSDQAKTRVDRIASEEKRLVTATRESNRQIEREEAQSARRQLEIDRDLVKSKEKTLRDLGKQELNTRADLGKQIADIEKQSQERIAQIDADAARERLQAGQAIANDQLIAQRNLFSSFESNDLDLAGATGSRKSDLDRREKAENSARQRLMQANDEANALTQKGDAVSAREIYAIRQQGIGRLLSLDKAYEDRKAELAKNPQALRALDQQYAEAVAAEQATQEAQVLIAKQALAQKEADRQAEKEQIRQNAQEQIALARQVADAQIAEFRRAADEQIAAQREAAAEQRKALAESLAEQRAATLERLALERQAVIERIAIEREALALQGKQIADATRQYDMQQAQVKADAMAYRTAPLGSVAEKVSRQAAVVANTPPIVTNVTINNPVVDTPNRLEQLRQQIINETQVRLQKQLNNAILGGQR